MVALQLLDAAIVFVLVFTTLALSGVSTGKKNYETDLKISAVVAVLTFAVPAIGVVVILLLFALFSLVAITFTIRIVRSKK